MTTNSELRKSLQMQIARKEKEIAQLAQGIKMREQQIRYVREDIDAMQKQILQLARNEQL